MACGIGICQGCPVELTGTERVRADVQRRTGVRYREDQDLAMVKTSFTLAGWNSRTASWLPPGPTGTATMWSSLRTSTSSAASSPKSLSLKPRPGNPPPASSKRPRHAQLDRPGEYRRPPVRQGEAPVSACTEHHGRRQHRRELDRRYCAVLDILEETGDIDATRSTSPARTCGRGGSTSGRAAR